MATLDLWPGFDVGVVPVAMFDGERTWLVRHPTPPDGYVVVDSTAAVRVRPGRDSMVWANSSAIIGGVPTATVMPATPGADARRQASVVVHEVFHVFQLARHRTWQGNEVSLFTYPFEDAEQLALRRLETLALRRALATGDGRLGSCWSAQVVAVRRERFGRMPPEAVAYERGSELREGLANYVQQRALGFPDEPLPAGDFPAEAVRDRTYAVGVAFGRLLDRFAPSWRESLERGDTTSLDALLGAATEQRAAGCSISASDHQAARRLAAADVGRLAAERAESRRSFLAQPGWMIVVVAADGGPLWSQGFDPLNVRMVAPGEVLHRRFARFGNDAGTIEVLGRALLSEAAGAHPLFNGVRTVRVSGLTAEPAVSVTGDTLRIDAPGVQAQFRGAALLREGPVLTVRLR